MALTGISSPRLSLRVQAKRPATPVARGDADDTRPIPSPGHLPYVMDTDYTTSTDYSRATANIHESLRLLGPVPELRIMPTAHVQQGRIAQFFDPASALQLNKDQSAASWRIGRPGLPPNPSCEDLSN